MVVVYRTTLSSPKWITWLAPALLILQLLSEGLSNAAASVGTGGKGGKWELLLNSSGVVAMHMALTHRNTVLMFDQTRSGPSAYPLRRRRRTYCRSTSDPANCWAHSVEYDVSTNVVRPLVLKTDTWCSSGSFLGNGTLVQTGGHGEGYRRVRYFHPCGDRSCDWTESKSLLAEDRWYASDQVLPEKDGRVIVVGGLGVYTYEFVPKYSSSTTTGDHGAFELPFLRRTRNRREEGDNLYPFLHLSSDGNLFVFANRDSILLDYKRHRVVKTFPRIPGDGSRSYPSTGSSVLLPLDHVDGFRKVEVMICGGAPTGAYRAAAKKHDFLEALSSCGRMVITAEKPAWAMEDMPGPRLLNDMLILPTGEVLIVNGATHGVAGWNKARHPSHSPYLYKPKNRAGKRFSVLNSSKIARLYHSSAVVLPDGRVLVAGSNPNRRYKVSGVPFPTELRVEAFVPHYMRKFFDDKRATNLSVHYHHGRGRSSYGSVEYGEEFAVRFELKKSERPSEEVVQLEFNVYAPPFATHSVSMNQRMLKLRCVSTVREEGGEMRAHLVAPPSPNVAPSGYYLLTIVNGGIPSKAIWVRFIHA